MSTTTLPQLVDEVFPGLDAIRTAEGYSVNCPACKAAHKLNLRTFPGVPGAALWTGCGCEHEQIAGGLGISEDTLDARLSSVGADAPTLAPEDTPKRGGVSANGVVDFILDNYRVGRSTDGLIFAVPTMHGAPRIAREVRSIRSDVLRAYREHSKAETGTGVIIGRDTLSSALDAVAAYAAADSPTPVALRSAQVGDDRVVLDLGDALGRVVEATPAGWSVRQADEETPLFRRSAATQPLPLPERGGDLDSLRDLLSLAVDDRRWKLIRGWLVGALFSEIPRPLLWATGPMGSGKSTRARMALSLLDPADNLGKQPGRNERDDSTAARGRYVVTYDNVTAISQATSDWLCRLVTGVTDDRRQLYSDDDLRPVTYKRTGVVTSITLPPGLGPDALERVMLVPFDRVPDHDRRAESTLMAAYETARPALLGAILDDVVLALRHLHEVRAERGPLPRMADYAQVLKAVDRGRSTGDDEGLCAAYVAAVDEALADSALDDPFAAAVLRLVDQRDGHIRLPAEGLVRPLVSAFGEDQQLPKWWPMSGRKVAAYLTRSAETLRHAGVTVSTGKTHGSRWVDLSHTQWAPSSRPMAEQPF